MPLFDDGAVEALKRGVDAMRLGQQVASHNIASMETPGYKAKEVEFKDVLRDMTQGPECLAKPMVEKNEDTRTEPNGNNVQVKRGGLELWRAYIQYSALTMRMSGKLSVLRCMISNTDK